MRRFDVGVSGSSSSSSSSSSCSSISLDCGSVVPGIGLETKTIWPCAADSKRSASKSVVMNEGRRSRMLQSGNPGAVLAGRGVEGVDRDVTATVGILLSRGCARRALVCCEIPILVFLRERSAYSVFLVGSFGTGRLHWVGTRAFLYCYPSCFSGPSSGRRPFLFLLVSGEGMPQIFDCGEFYFTFPGC